MKKIVVFSLATLLTTSCCNLIQYDANFPSIFLELRDSETGEDLFANGAFNVDSLAISNTEYPDQHFDVVEQPDRIQILFGPGHEEYTISVSQQISFELNLQFLLTDHKCYTDRSISSILVVPFTSQVTAIENSNDWSVIVFIN